MYSTGHEPRVTLHPHTPETGSPVTAGGFVSC